MRTVGTKVRGIRAPIIKEGDNLVDIVVKTIMNSCKEEGYKLYNNDVIGITESVVARAQGNYVLLDDIAQEIKDKFSKNVGIVFPILSRNRFSMILKGIAKSNYQIYLQLSYPRDEVGNALMDINEMEEAGIDPHCDIINGEEYLKQFGGYKHPFTGINYVKYYKELVEKDQIKIILSNNPETILKYTDSIIAADIHTRNRTKDILKKAGAGNLIGLDELCVEDKGRGYNPKYGLLGSNKASENKLKLFPRNGKVFVNEVQKKLKKLTKKNIEVMIYGDGAFKDPVGKIWELADPVVSPAFTFGLKGTPNEVKLKYLADNDFKDLEGKELLNAMKKEIKNKDSDLVGKGKAQGTTPRQITDLLGSLCDLVSGSGDKGTPIILIQGYFDNLSTD
ncbi:MAG: coenzyme F420-0:L-glutamate ligase [Halanaerobiales bacterium]|nr:coenzyme F420-0:L-glutamate ligase [Halanaerobiales bacterium]